MGSRYASAHQEIRAILQRAPHFTAKQLWHELTTWPIPSERTIHRFMQGVKHDLAVAGKLAAAAEYREPAFDRFEQSAQALLSQEHFLMDKEMMDKLDGISSHLDSLHKRFDAIEEERKVDRARIDTACAKVEQTEKERADVAAKERAVAGESYNDRAAAQMRLDAACQAWGKPARAPLNGETLRNYRISILNDLKSHSRVYKDSNLETIGDEAAFSNIEALIINDAIQASITNVAHGAPLRASIKVNDMGHRVTTFHGDPAVTWAPFMGGHVRFGKIVRHPNG